MDSPEYRRWVKAELCIVAAMGTLHNDSLKCGGPNDPHHIRQGSGAGMGMKPSDAECVSHCHVHHDEYHRIGHDDFLKKYELTDLDYERAKVRTLSGFNELLLSKLERFVVSQPQTDSALRRRLEKMSVGPRVGSE